MSKKNKNRNCNICGKLEKASDDHVPPKSCNNKGRKEAYNIFDKNILNSTLDSNIKYLHFQNGVYFSSICEYCNNTLLGRQYDDYLAKFTNEIKEKLDNKFELNKNFPINCKINRIVRAVVGHLLAAFGEYCESSPTEIEMRKYFLNEEMEIVDDHFLYIWIHPYNNIQIARNFGIFGKTPLHKSVISILKFPPVAFVLSDKKINDNMLNLFELTTSRIDDEIQINISSNTVKGLNNEIRCKDWPLHINDDYVFITSNNVYSNTVSAE